MYNCLFKALKMKKAWQMEIAGTPRRVSFGFLFLHKLKLEREKARDQLGTVPAECCSGRGIGMLYGIVYWKGEKLVGLSISEAWNERSYEWPEGMVILQHPYIHVCMYNTYSCNEYPGRLEELRSFRQSSRIMNFIFLPVHSALTSALQVANILKGGS